MKQQALQQFIKEFKKEYFTLSAEQISFPRSCNNLKKYRSSKDIFIKGSQYTLSALIYNYQIQRMKLQNKYPYIQEGDKIKFVKLLEQNLLDLMLLVMLQNWPTEFKLRNVLIMKYNFKRLFSFL